MNSEPLVTVIIPTLNRPELTLKALQSVKRQSYSALEVTIVDNGSSPECLEEMTARGIVFERCEVRGAGAARKFGLRSSKGEFVLFLDSDDTLLPDAISKLLGALDSSRHGAYGLVSNKNVSTLEVQNVDSALKWPLASNTLLRRSVFEEFGEFFDDNYSFPEWMVKSLDSGLTLGFINEMVAVRLVHGGNLSITDGSMPFFFHLIRSRLRGRK